MLLSFLTINLKPLMTDYLLQQGVLVFPPYYACRLHHKWHQPLGNLRTRDVPDKNLVILYNVCSLQKPDEFSPLRML